MRNLRVDQIPGGKGDKAKASDFDPVELSRGIEVELEHTDDVHIALEIALDHLEEDPHYYTKLAKIHKEHGPGFTRLKNVNLGGTSLGSESQPSPPDDERTLNSLQRAAMRASKAAMNSDGMRAKKIELHDIAHKMQTDVVRAARRLGKHPGSVIHHVIHRDHHRQTAANLRGGGEGFKPDRSDTDPSKKGESVDTSISWLEGLYGYLLSETEKLEDVGPDSGFFFGELVAGCREELDEGIIDTVRSVMGRGRAGDREGNLTPEQQKKRKANRAYLKQRRKVSPSDPAHVVKSNMAHNQKLYKKLHGIGGN